MKVWRGSSQASCRAWFTLLQAWHSSLLCMKKSSVPSIREEHFPLRPNCIRRIGQVSANKKSKLLTYPLPRAMIKIAFYSN
mmetsp:Transcript_49811/g.97438  ORF Transcript_49811/g.97438 Transcript_49811/m.97438 type:complete len:81 (-) Transcript_49811:174-416(-)